MTARRRLLVVGSAAAAVLLAIVVWWVVADPGEGSSAADGAADQDAGDGFDGSGGSSGADAFDARSAARGPQGTRSASQPPDEFPAGLVPADADDVSGQIARDGSDWSVLVTFLADGPRESLEATVDAATEAAGFRRRDAAQTEARLTITYDGPDGEVLAVTLGPDAATVPVSASLVGPG